MDTIPRHNWFIMGSKTLTGIDKHLRINIMNRAFMTGPELKLVLFSVPKICSWGHSTDTHNNMEILKNIMLSERNWTQKSVLYHSIHMKL